MIEFVFVIMKMFRDLFMLWFRIPVADLGFTVGSFLIFIFILRMSLGLFMNIGMSFGTGRSVVSGGSKLGRKIASVSQKYNEKYAKVKEKK